MTFTKRLRDGVRRGEITCSVRIWTRPHVTVGNRYRMEEGEIEVDSIKPIGFPDITPALARESGFLGVVDLLKVAKRGKGENISTCLHARSPHVSASQHEEGLLLIQTGRALFSMWIAQRIEGRRRLTCCKRPSTQGGTGRMAYLCRDCAG